MRTYPELSQGPEWIYELQLGGCLAHGRGIQSRREYPYLVDALAELPEGQETQSSVEKSLHWTVRKG